MTLACTSGPTSSRHGRAVPRLSALVLLLLMGASAMVPCNDALAQDPVGPRPESQGRRPTPAPQAAPGSRLATPGLEGAGTEAPTDVPSIERFMKIRAPGSPTRAPDGTLYVRDWPDGIWQLYRRRAGQPIDAPMERLTEFPDGISGYALSPDGRWIIVSASAGGSEQDDLHLYDTTTGRLRTLYADPDIVYTFQCWIGSGSAFIFSANEASRSDFHLYRHDIASAERRKLLGETGYWVAVESTDDGARALVSRYISQSRAEAYELDTATAQLSAIDVRAGDAYNEPLGYLPGAPRAAAIVCDVQEGIRRIFVRDLESGTVTRPFTDLDRYDVEAWKADHDRSHAAITFNEDGFASIRIVSLPGFTAPRTPPIEQGVVGSVDLRNRMLTWTLSNARTPGVAFAWRLDTRAMPQPITVAETQGIDLSQFPLPALVTYPSFDGREIPAFLYTPPGYTPGQPIPFVANFHGGPESQFRPQFSALIQYLLASGYGVIQPNVRGSTGYGREFHRLDDYRNRWDSVRDGVEAARWLVRRGYARAGGIAAYGGSYGGFMSVATVIEDPEIFGASINVVGIVNFVTFLEQTRDYRRALREVEYGPLSDTEFLRSISPIHRIDEIRVPMLIAHGLNDPRVPVGEAMQLAVGLQRRGLDPELLFFPDEGHGFAKLNNRLLFAERMVKFLGRTIR